MSPTQRVLVALFVLVQLALPMSYYVDDDPFDERFAWRMFSPQRMVRCAVELRDGASGERLDPDEPLPSPWVTWLERGHGDVARAWALHACEEEGFSSLHGQLTCRMPDGEVVVPLRLDEELCP